MEAIVGLLLVGGNGIVERAEICLNHSIQLIFANLLVRSVLL